MTDPWIAACTRVEVIGRTIGVVVSWWALACATCGVARAVWLLISLVIERTGR